MLTHNRSDKPYAESSIAITDKFLAVSYNTTKHRVRKLFKGAKLKLHDRNGKKVTKQEIYTALIQADGNVVEACKMLNLTNFCAFSDWLSTDKSALELSEFFRNKLVNEALNVVMLALRGDDKKAALDAAKFVLRTLGKNLGYSESPIVNVDMRSLDPDETKRLVLALFGMSSEEQLPEVPAQDAEVIEAEEVLEDKEGEACDEQEVQPS